MKDTIRFRGLTLNGDEQSAQHGELSLCGNVELHDGALRPSVLKGTELAGGEKLPGTLKYVHVTSKYTNFITRVYSRDPSYSGLFWYREGTVDGSPGWVRGTIVTGLPSSDDGFRSISSVGNTLCILFDNGLNYFLCKEKMPEEEEEVQEEEEEEDESLDTEQEYEYLGSKPPFAEIQFNLHDMTDVKDNGTVMTIDESREDGIRKEYELSLGDVGVGLLYDKPDDILYYIPGQYFVGDLDQMTVTDTLRSSVTEQVLGIVNRRINDAAEKKLFYAPFLVRYCYRLFDGSMIMHSAPVLMAPSLERSVLVSVKNLVFWDVGNQLYIAQNFSERCNVMVFMLLGKLQARWVNSAVNDELQKWKDIVKSVDVFITPQFSRIDSSGLIENIKDGNKVVYKEGSYEMTCLVHSLMDGIDGQDRNSDRNTRGRFGDYWTRTTGFDSQDDRTYYNHYLLMLPEYSEDEHMYKVSNASTFYRIASYKTEELKDELAKTGNPFCDIDMKMASL